MRIKLSFQDIVELQNHVACHRDEPSYKTLFLHFHKPLLELAYSFVKSHETAEELVCDVLMKIWTMKDTLLKIKNLKFYLYQSVRNASLNELKKNKKHNGENIENLAGQPDDSLCNPEELLIKDELTFRISTAIGRHKKRIQIAYYTARWHQCMAQLRQQDHYADNFEGDTREVTLAGEAFFDVVKNPAKPFIIHTGAMDVKVLGTEFNVRSYPTEATTETALLRGMIEVTLHGKEKKKIILKPNEKLTVLNNEEVLPLPAGHSKKEYA
jgi:DNA-directed RNA polymerase specialized sigma24 family protein